MAYDINVRTQAASPALDWRKSSFCSASSTCVEVSALPDGGTAMRDGKDPAGPILSFGAAAWVQFLSQIRAGEFDSNE